MSIFKKVRRLVKRRARVAQTVRELNKLTDRELSDIGIARSDIYFRARKSID